MQTDDYALARPARRVVRLFPYLVVAFVPLALLDMRLPLPGIKVRLSDFYLIFLFMYFLGVHRDALRWTLHCLLAFAPFFLYVVVTSAAAGNVSGLLEAVQWGLVMLWVPLLSYALRDGDEALVPFLMYGLLGVAVYVAISHILDGHIVRYKYMGDAKYTFGMLTLTAGLSCLRFKNLGSFVTLAIALVIMGMSLERTGTLMSTVSLILGFIVVGLRLRGLTVSILYSSVALVLLCSGFIIYSLFIAGDMDVTHFIDEELATWESNLHRQNLISNGVEIYLQHPWLGVGAKTLQEYMRNYYLEGHLALYTHNWYLDFFIEYGLIGVLLFHLVVIGKILRVSASHALAWLLLPLAFYCLSVPVFMANGTTTMLIYLTAIACFIATGYRRTSQ